MNATFLKALVALVPVCLLVWCSLLWFLRERALSSLLQLLGALCLGVVVLVHLCEALHVFAFMQWGSPHSIGHYLDFSSALLGLTVFPLGFLFHRFTNRHLHQKRATS
jgi:formate hydrogenlyase subunit 3/multisubunit Na+/H+ antiporter MnhD subunit